MDCDELDANQRVTVSRNPDGVGFFLTPGSQDSRKAGNPGLRDVTASRFQNTCSPVPEVCATLRAKDGDCTRQLHSMVVFRASAGRLTQPLFFHCRYQAPPALDTLYPSTLQFQPRLLSDS